MRPERPSAYEAQFEPYCSEKCRDEAPPPKDAKYHEDKTARAWHKVPSEWRALSSSDRAEMMSHEMIEATHEAYRSELRLIRMKKASGKKDDGLNPLQRQKQKWLGKSET